MNFISQLSIFFPTLILVLTHFLPLDAGPGRFFVHESVAFPLSINDMTYIIHYIPDIMTYDHPHRERSGRVGVEVIRTLILPNLPATDNRKVKRHFVDDNGHYTY